MRRRSLVTTEGFVEAFSAFEYAMAELAAELAAGDISAAIAASASVVASLVASSTAVGGGELSLIGGRREIRESGIFGDCREFEELIIGIDLCNNIFET